MPVYFIITLLTLLGTKSHGQAVKTEQVISDLKQVQTNLVLSY